ncbi:Negative regulator of sigma E activity [Candidatus Burkholderia humilis]|nr:Negative regulator of sigma E activity [Candidatus Burkholderia humilis]
MLNIRTASLVVIALSAAALLTLPVAPAPAQAQDSGASTPKQVRKAERKEARAKKNAELKDLEKNGYNPGGEQTNYPQNLQNAQKKVEAEKAGKAAPASTP